jgi:hypothetical protein
MLPACAVRYREHVQEAALLEVSVLRCSMLYEGRDWKGVVHLDTVCAESDECRLDYYVPGNDGLSRVERSTNDLASLLGSQKHTEGVVKLGYLHNSEFVEVAVGPVEDTHPVGRRRLRCQYAGESQELQIPLGLAQRYVRCVSLLRLNGQLDVSASVRLRKFGHKHHVLTTKIQLTVGDSLFEGEYVYHSALIRKLKGLT